MAFGDINDIRINLGLGFILLSVIGEMCFGVGEFCCVIVVHFPLSQLIDV